MRYRANLILAAMAIAAAGCGGAVPGLGPMGNSLTDGLATPELSPPKGGRSRSARRGMWPR
jgi:hypothetical protein